MNQCSLLIIVALLILLILSYQHLLSSDISEHFDQGDFQERLQRLQKVYREGGLTPREYSETMANLQATPSKSETDRLKRIQTLFQQGLISPREYSETANALESDNKAGNKPHNTASIIFQTEGNWWIYHNSKYIRSGGPTGTDVISLDINNVKSDDKLQFRIGATGKGGLIGQIIIGDRTIVTNASNFKITGQQIRVNPGDRKSSVGYPASDYLPEYSGGKYMGCFQDGNPRALPTSSGENVTIADCHQRAVDGNYPYYGIQYGGQCWLGKEHAKYEMLPSTKCGQRCNKNSNEYCGSNMVNQVYSILDSPSVVEIGDNLGYSECDNCIQDINKLWCSNDNKCYPHGDPIGNKVCSSSKSCVGNPANKGGCSYTDCSALYPGFPTRNPKISGAAKWIIPKQHDLSSNFPGGVWEFVWTNTPPKRMAYCNYPEYSKFQPSACSDPSDSSRCWSSQKTNYEADPTQCGLKFKPSGNYDDPTFFSILNRAYQKSSAPGVDQNRSTELKNRLKTAYKAACQVVLEAGHRREYDALCHDITPRPNKNHCNVPVDKRSPIPTLTSKLQGSQPDSPDWEQAKSSCRQQSGCFESNSKLTPRCYKPDMNQSINTDSQRKMFNAGEIRPDRKLKNLRRLYDNGVISQDQFTEMMGEIALEVEKSPKNLTLDRPSPGFFTAITEASRLVNTVDLKKSNSVARWKFAMKQLLDTARIVEWDPGNKKGCRCRSEFEDPSSLKCYPC